MDWKRSRWPDAKFEVAGAKCALRNDRSPAQSFARSLTHSLAREKRDERGSRPRKTTTTRRREKREERREKSEERRERREETREKTEDRPQEAARGPQMRPPEGPTLFYAIPPSGGTSGGFIWGPFGDLATAQKHPVDVSEVFFVFRGVRGGVFPKDSMTLRPSRWLAEAA